MKIDFKPRETFPTTQEQQTSTCLTAALIRYWTRFSMSALVGLCLALPHAQAQIARDPTYPRPKGLTTNERLEMLITLYDIVKIPNKVMGQETTVTGYVTDVYGPRLFVIRGYGPIISSRVPVLAAEPLVPLYGRSEDAPVRVGDRVQITGKVARFARDETERITGKPVEKPIAQRFQNKPTIVTDFVVVSPGQQGQAITASGRNPEAVEDTLYYVYTLPDLNRAPETDRTSPLGKSIRLENVRVKDVISDRGFWIDTGSDSRLFAVLRPSLNRGAMEQLVRIQKGQTLNLNGTLLPMPDKVEMQRRWSVIDAGEAAELAKERTYFYVSAVHFQKP